MSRKPHEPTDATRQTVQLHTTVGTTQAIIADILGIDDKTLRLYYREELDVSKAKANATIGGALFNKAKSGDTAAMIFWMKTQAGWRETSVHEHGGIGGGPIQTQEVSALDRINSKLDGIAARSRPDGDPSGTE